MGILISRFQQKPADLGLHCNEKMVLFFLKKMMCSVHLLEVNTVTRQTVKTRSDCF